MSIEISIGPCCWGVDDADNPSLPPWERVLSEASQAGYKGIELGPYGYLPLDVKRVEAELDNNGLSVVAGTIFDDLVSEDNLNNLIKQVDDICSLITKLPNSNLVLNKQYPPPYLVLIDWGHEHRDYDAGHPERARRLNDKGWHGMMANIRALSERAWNRYGVRPVIHPHAGGYIEFEDEIVRVLQDIPNEIAGLCLDTGHLYYSKMDPVQWLKDCSNRLDYVHFKDIDLKLYRRVMNEKIQFFQACAKGVMCPIGQGIIDYPSIRGVLTDIDYSGYITVEQERDPVNVSTSLVDVKKSREYLTRVGF